MFYFWFALVFGLVLVLVLVSLVWNNFSCFFFPKQFGALRARNIGTTIDLLTLFIAFFIDDFFKNLVIVAMLVSLYTCKFEYVSHLCRVRSLIWFHSFVLNLVGFDHMTFVLVMRLRPSTWVILLVVNFVNFYQHDLS